MDRSDSPSVALYNAVLEGYWHRIVQEEAEIHIQCPSRTASRIEH